MTDETIHHDLYRVATEDRQRVRRIGMVDGELVGREYVRDDDDPPGLLTCQEARETFANMAAAREWADRVGLVPCPDCDGAGGEQVIRHWGRGYYECYPDFDECEACEATGWVTPERAEQLIGWREAAEEQMAEAAAEAEAMRRDEEEELF